MSGMYTQLISSMMLIQVMNEYNKGSYTDKVAVPEFKVRYFKLQTSFCYIAPHELEQ